MASGRFIEGNRNLGEGVGTLQGVRTGVMKEHKGQDVLWEVAFLGLGRLHLISWGGVGREVCDSSQALRGVSWVGKLPLSESTVRDHICLAWL